MDHVDLQTKYYQLCFCEGISCYLVAAFSVLDVSFINYPIDLICMVW